MSAVRIVVVGLVTLAAAQARAEDDTQPTARAHLDRGVAAYHAGDFDLAHRELEQASMLAPDKPNPYRWLALTEVQLGACAKAIVNVEGFLSRVPTDDPRIGELVRLRDLCLRSGVVRFASVPSGATILVDDQARGVTPSRLELRAGSHVVTAAKPGFNTTMRSVVVPAAGELDVAFELSPEDVPVTRRWWFWTTLGVAVVSASVGAIYLATRDREDTRLPPIECTAAGCQP